MADNKPARKRDRLKNIFSRPGSQSPQPPPSLEPAASNPAFAAFTNTSLPQRILQAALDQLTKDDREIIKTDSSNLFNDSYNAALEKQRLCKEKQWKWTFRGDVVYLSDIADKVVTCLNTLRPVGDAAAAAGDIYVSIPWTAVKALLSILTANQEQTALLLSGMITALATANRLQAYLRFLQDLPADSTTADLETAVVKLYAHVLQFLASASRIYNRNTLLRSITALWTITSLEDFQKDCQALGNDAEIAASTCDRTLNAHDRELAKQARATLDQANHKLDALLAVKDIVTQLNTKIDLKDLRTAEGAAFNSHANEHNAICLEGTRIELRQQIKAWADDADGKPIFWLCGKAGTGKSTIARTIGYMLQDRLGASFFFKRGEGDRGRAARFIPTIVRQLADRVPSACPAIAAALAKDSFLCEGSLEEQFEVLLKQPFSQETFSANIIIIDALDECDSVDDIRKVLQLLTRKGTLTAAHLRIFVTSRPEFPIQAGFRSADGTLHHDVFLEQVPPSTITRDLTLYFNHRFDEIKATALQHEPETLRSQWPGDECIQRLVALATPLFIYAFIVCRFIEERTPRDRLNTILQQRYTLSGLGKTYTPILQQLTLGKDAETQRGILADFQYIVGTIVLLAGPLNIEALRKLLVVSLDRIYALLQDLQSALDVSHDSLIRPLHLSFRDFLISDRRLDTGRFEAGEFHVPEKEVHWKIATLCLNLLEAPGILKRDICDVKKPGTRQASVSKDVVNACLPSEVAYACSYWAKHVVDSEHALYDGDQVHTFLQRHFLHWLEALSWLGRLSTAQSLIEGLRSRIKTPQNSEMEAFLADALKTIRTYRGIIENAPMQLYHAVLTFLPTDSIVRMALQHERLATFSITPDAEVQWSSEALRLEMQRRWYWDAVVFSPERRYIAAFKEPNTITVWDAEYGIVITKLEAKVESMAFISNDKLAILDQDGLIQIRGIIQEFIGTLPATMKSPIHSVDFSATGARAVLTTRAQRHKLWNMSSSPEPMKPGDDNHSLRGVALACSGLPVATIPGDDSSRPSYMTSDISDHHVDSAGNRRASTITSKNQVRFSENALGPERASRDNDVTVAEHTEPALTCDSLELDPVNHKRLDKLSGRFVEVRLTSYPDWIESSTRRYVAFFARTGTITVFKLGSGSEICERADGEFDLVTGDGELFVISKLDGSYHCADRSSMPTPCLLSGHGCLVTQAAFTPDETFLISRYWDGTVKVWHVTSSAPFLDIVEPRQAITYLACLDETHFAISWSNGVVRLCDIESDTPARRLEGQHEDVTAAGLSSCGSRLATLSVTGVIKIWDIHKAAVLNTWVLDSTSIDKVAFSQDLDTMAGRICFETLSIWSTSAGTVIKIDANFHDIHSLHISQDEKRLGVALKNGTVELFDMFNGQTLKIRYHFDGSFKAIQLAGEDTCIASVLNDGRIKLERFKHDIRSEWKLGVFGSICSVEFASTADSMLARINGGGHLRYILWDISRREASIKLEQDAQAAAFSRDAKRIAFASWDGKISIWSIEHGTAIATFRADPGPDAIMFLWEDKHIASLSRQAVRLWNVDSAMAKHATFQTGAVSHSRCVNWLALSPHGLTIASASEDSNIILWDFETGEMIKVLRGHSESVIDIQFSPDGLHLASISGGGDLKLWNGRTGEHRVSLKSDDISPTSLFSPDSKMLLYARSASAILWDVETDTRLATVSIRPDSGYSMAFSPDSQHILYEAAGHECGVKVFTTSGKLSRSLQGRNRQVDSITFSADGRLVVTSCYEAVELFNFETGELLKTFEVNDQGTSLAVISPSGRYIASRQGIGELKLWDVNAGTVIQSLRLDTPNDTLIFSDDESYLKSHRGVLPVGRNQASPLQPQPLGLFVSEQWISQGGQDILWLPLEYRAMCVVVQGNRVCLGHSSGRVSFLTFDEPHMDESRN